MAERLARIAAQRRWAIGPMDPRALLELGGPPPRGRRVAHRGRANAAVIARPAALTGEPRGAGGVSLPEGRELRVRAEGVEWRVLEHETVVLDLHRSLHFAINTTGTLLWPLLVRGATTARLSDALTDAGGVERAQAAQEVQAFCTRLDTEGLLERDSLA